MLLQGTRCVVRPWRRTDAEALVRHANNVNVAKYLRDRFPHPYTDKDARHFLKQTTSTGDMTNLAIEVGGEAVGAVGFVPGRDVERFSAEIGYWLGEELWGRGIVTEALTLVTGHTFTRAEFPSPLRPAVCRQSRVRACAGKGGLREGGGASLEQREIRRAERSAALRPDQSGVEGSGPMTEGARHSERRAMSGSTLVALRAGM